MYAFLQFVLHLLSLKEALQISNWQLLVLFLAKLNFVALNNMLNNSLHKVNICLFPWLSVHGMAVIKLLT